jgi:hypothetical protein
MSTIVTILGSTKRTRMLMRTLDESLRAMGQFGLILAQCNLLLVRGTALFHVLHVITSLAIILASHQDNKRKDTLSCFSKHSPIQLQPYHRISLSRRNVHRTTNLNEIFQLLTRGLEFLLHGHDTF